MCLITGNGLNCQQEVQLVTEGDTNVVIPCNHGTQTAAPFWRVNRKVYDVFHVPIYFRVDSYSSLTIPVIHPSFDDYTFQCVLINHMTDSVTEIPGRITQLIVQECESSLL